ncbi:hypothetical protein B0H14DRAFT_2585525 [Mycena olivaceomarginata]|nr:hypothetical protein B0H14DRAFT_2585525 [Mycena olivaceomarginata]
MAHPASGFLVTVQSWELFLDSINRWHSTSFYRACTENSVKDFPKGERHCGDPSHVKLTAFFFDARVNRGDGRRTSYLFLCGNLEADDWESLEVSVVHVRNEACAQSSFGTFWDGLPGPARKRIRDKALS